MNTIDRTRFGDKRVDLVSNTSFQHFLNGGANNKTVNDKAVKTKTDKRENESDSDSENENLSDVVSVSSESDSENLDVNDSTNDTDYDTDTESNDSGNSDDLDDLSDGNDESDEEKIQQRIEKDTADKARFVSRQKQEANDKHNEEKKNEKNNDKADDQEDVVDDVIRDETMELMKKNYSHPEPDDPNIQYKLYKKREYYYNKIPRRPEINDDTDYSVIKDYRYNTCDRPFALHEHQGMLSNVINPDTPYKGIIVYHGLGSGKTCVGVAIAEKFKPMVQKYNTKIYILVPGPIIKESWRTHLIRCTGETYKKYQDKYAYMDAAEKNRLDKQAIAQALQYYRIMSYRSFYKRVLGEKVVDKKVTKNNKTKTTYRKNKEGEFERDLAVDRIYNLNNTVIIVDEAHNLTGNAYGKALEKIIQNSINLKVVLMSATLMKNLGSDIIELVNFLRPKDSPMERDKIFNSHKNHLMDFKPGGLEYFKNMVNGYVSHVRGSDPLTFAKRNDKGEIPEGLLFTKMIRCQMLKFQRETYDSTVKDFDDALDRASEAVANMSFPGLSKDRKSLTGYYGREGLNIVKEQLKVSSELLNKKIGEMFNDTKDDQEWMYITQDGKTITGKIYKIPYLKNFSIKFYKSLKKLNRLVAGKKGAQTAFVYSNLVKVGIDVFQEILLQNGYLEYQEDATNYQINPDTVCYFCGKKHKDHARLNRMARSKAQESEDDDEEEYGKKKDATDADFISDDGFSEDSEDSDDEDTSSKATKSKSKSANDKVNIKISETSTEYSPRVKPKLGVIPPHKFYPATFVSITGKSSEEKAELINEDKKRILDNVFNTIENREGKYIKLILGSKVMNEGISMRNVGEVHVLDVYFNLGKVDQVVGRAIRWCSHYKMMGENNVWPYVNVFKYVVSLGEDSRDGLSSEEELYKKAEMKYLLINRIERAMKERAFDCPLNMNGNIFTEEVRKYEKCDLHGELKCPAICNYTKCDYKCDDPKLNYEYYDPNRKVYKAVSKNDLDYSTFTHGLAESEIEYAKNKIKNMYITSPVYTLRDIVDYVKNSYDEEKRELFDEFFVYKALDSLIPVSENDFNNFRDTIVDKNNTQGYLIYRDNYYIFQPFTQPEDVPLYYRVNNTQDIHYELSLYNYLKNSDSYKRLKDDKKKGTDKSGKTRIIEDVNVYNFDDTMEYYDSREEYEIVGIVDKEISRRKNKRADEIKDVFKIRPKLPKVLDKKRGTGIPSLKGAVCATSKSKEYLDNTANKLGAVIKPEMTRIEVCEAIESKMLEKEKYSTDKDKNKVTYVRIPANHPKYPFPYNLEDRVKYLIGKIRSEIKHAIDITTAKNTVKSGANKGKPSYNIIIKKKPNLDEYADFLKKLGAVADKDTLVITVE
ncbi:DEXDc helicase [Yasminevirus sp. GU-2018]|uniref:DEXDc helicase n=1 Tax=Yasminevirus sp. GU-2018 TaxID=2420051 RepID=A0A5K0U7K2_9VIRU|nr:DEXDc helicase [Yasminevirus sp. GU-2018]